MPYALQPVGDTWQIGTTSIREDHLIASGLRFAQWRHASPNIDARKEPKNNPTVKVYQLLQDELARADGRRRHFGPRNHSRSSPKSA